MKYVLEINENEGPDEIRFWATVQGLDGCFIAEETLDELFASAPEVIRDFVEVGNERGGSFALPTEVEFRICVKV
ncbi:hypothetical protein GC173_06690 [bacterium]|nr:hypothetical protein [bacterium]